MKPIRNLTTIMTTMALALPATLFADTVIELNGNNEAMTFISNGNKARINTRGKNDYMIVDYTSRAIYAVRPDERQIINLNQSIPRLGSSKPPELRLALTAAGNGPVVAGYATQSYRLSADGENCGTVHASKEVLNGTGIGDMLDVMNEMAENARKALGGFAAVIPPCRQAQMSLGSQVDRIGAPLLTVDAHGQVQSEIRSIRKNVSISADSYALPAEYQSAGVADKVMDTQQINTNVEQPQKHAPQVQDRMRRMQQSGRLPPQALEQIQRYREMLQQRRR